MSKKGEFTRELDKLYHLRTHWLRSILENTKLSSLRSFNRKELNRGIINLQTIASDSLANKLAKAEFSEHVPSKRTWHVKGHGRDRKKMLFDRWYKRVVLTHQECVYAFWGKRKCVYIGRTGNGGKRPREHFDKFWFSGVTRIDIYSVNTPSQLPKLECLAIHRFLPVRNKKKASTLKWTKKCPLCKVHKDIQRELRNIFRFK
jgi:hypothetical protein